MIVKVAEMSGNTVPDESLQNSGLQTWLRDDSEIAAIRRRYPAWVVPSIAFVPLYSLPKEVIDRFEFAARQTKQSSSSDSKPSKSFSGWNADQVAAEREFAKLCQRKSAIGYHFNQFITGSFVGLPTLRNAPELNLSKEMYLEIIQALSTPTARQKGAAGFLLTHPPYIEEVQNLQVEWQLLPKQIRPSFPLKLIQVPVCEKVTWTTNTSPEITCFALHLKKFLTKWNLMYLSAWDLPEPQGMLMPNYLPMNAPAQPQGSITISIPPSERFKTGELESIIAELQRAHVRTESVDPRYAALQHHDLYGTMFDVLHLERAILSRYPNKQPRGLMTVLVNSTARFYKQHLCRRFL